MADISADAAEPTPVVAITGIEVLSDSYARDVIAHLCGEDCRGMGETVEWCEGRNDCYLVVTCVGCSTTFTLSEEQYEALVAWSEAHGNALSCGIIPIAS